MNDLISVIVNATAGSAPQGDAIAAAFAANGVAADILLVHDASEMSAAIDKAMAAAPSRIAAAGGDGTINAVASRLVDTGIALAILPLGTLNHFAKDAGIPLELEAAVRNVIHGAVTTVDVGVVNEHVFLNNSSLGLYPHIVHLRERQQERLGRGKWPAFAWAAFMVFRRSAFMRIGIETKGQRVERKTPLVFVGNNPYVMEGLNIGSRAQLQSAELGVYVARVLNRWGLVKLALRAAFGRARRDPDLDVFSTTSLSVTSRKRAVLVSVDGEVRALQPPLEYRIRPRALCVIAPPASVDVVERS